MKKQYILDEEEVKIIRKIVRVAISEDNREKVRNISAENRLFNDQELAQAEEFLK